MEKSLAGGKSVKYRGWLHFPDQGWQIVSESIYRDVVIDRLESAVNLLFKTGYGRRCTAVGKIPIDDIARISA